VRAATDAGARSSIPRSTRDEHCIALRGEGDADCIGCAQAVLADDDCGVADRRLVKHFGIEGDCPFSRTMA
jgi:hypothetical protein